MTGEEEEQKAGHYGPPINGAYAERTKVLLSPPRRS